MHYPCRYRREIVRGPKPKPRALTRSVRSGRYVRDDRDEKSLCHASADAPCQAGQSRIICAPTERLAISRAGRRWRCSAPQPLSAPGPTSAVCLLVRTSRRENVLASSADDDLSCRSTRLRKLDLSAARRTAMKKICSAERCAPRGLGCVGNSIADNYR